MGSSNSKPTKIIHYLPGEPVKGETRPFRSTAMPLDVPLSTQLPGGISTMLECFE